jgi:hypothetical protein
LGRERAADVGGDVGEPDAGGEHVGLAAGGLAHEGVDVEAGRVLTRQRRQLEGALVVGRPGLAERRGGRIGIVGRVEVGAPEADDGGRRDAREGGVGEQVRRALVDVDEGAEHGRRIGLEVEVDELGARRATGFGDGGAVAGAADAADVDPGVEGLAPLVHDQLVGRLGQRAALDGPLGGHVVGGVGIGQRRGIGDDDVAGVDGDATDGLAGGGVGPARVDRGAELDGRRLVGGLGEGEGPVHGGREVLDLTGEEQRPLLVGLTVGCHRAQREVAEVGPVEERHRDPGAAGRQGAGHEEEVVVVVGRVEAQLEVRRDGLDPHAEAEGGDGVAGIHAHGLVADGAVDVDGHLVDAVGRVVDGVDRTLLALGRDDHVGRHALGEVRDVDLAAGRALVGAAVGLVGALDPLLEAARHGGRGAEVVGDGEGLGAGGERAVLARLGERRAGRDQLLVRAAHAHLEVGGQVLDPGGRGQVLGGAVDDDRRHRRDGLVVALADDVVVTEVRALDVEGHGEGVGAVADVGLEAEDRTVVDQLDPPQVGEPGHEREGRAALGDGGVDGRIGGRRDREAVRPDDVVANLDLELADAAAAAELAVGDISGVAGVERGVVEHVVVDLGVERLVHEHRRVVGEV